MPNYHLIEHSETLAQNRIFGFYVREQIEAHGTLMPEWLIEDLSGRAGELTDLAVSHMLFEIGLDGYMDREYIEVALEAITIRSMELRTFAEFVQELVKKTLDDPTQEW